jgi:hypothetical protein
MKISGKRALIALAVFGAALGVGGVAYATIPSSGGVYTACELKGVGAVRLIDPSLSAKNFQSHCTPFEEQISWNQSGPPGRTGATGPAGTNGAIGQAGPQGPTGDRGAVGQTGPEGPTGDRGATGQAGPQGPTGAVGAGSLTLSDLAVWTFNSTQPGGSLAAGSCFAVDVSGTAVTVAPGDLLMGWVEDTASLTFNSVIVSQANAADIEFCNDTGTTEVLPASLPYTVIALAP